MTALDQSAMRRVNAQTVLQVVYAERAAITLAALSARTGLSRRTVDLILGELENAGWVRLLAPDMDPSRRGRPARQVEFVARSGCVLAVDIAHEQTTVTVADLYGTPLATAVEHMPGEPERAERLRLTRRAIASALVTAQVDSTQLGAVTIATPGNVNDRGSVDVGLSMKGWIGFAPGPEFADDFECQVHVENDAKLAVRAEMWRGSVVGADHVVWLMLDGAYNGMSIVVDGVVHRGVDGAAGEFTWATKLGLDALASPPLVGLGRTASSAQRAWAQDVLDAARRGERDALRYIDQYADALASGVSTISWILAPRFVVLGGAVSDALGEMLIDRVRVRLEKSGPAFVRVTQSSLSDSAVTMGAVRSGLERFDWNVRSVVV